MDLYLDIPLKNATATKVKGSISMQKADLAMGWPKPPLKDVEGTVHFSEKGATASNVHARPFGSGDASVSVTHHDRWLYRDQRFGFDGRFSSELVCTKSLFRSCCQAYVPACFPLSLRLS